MPDLSKNEITVPTIFSHESVEAAVTKAVGDAIHAIEPRLQKFATQVAHQTIDRGQEVVERAYKRVQRQPLLLLGIAAAALAGVAITIFVQNQKAQTVRQLH